MTTTTNLTNAAWSQIGTDVSTMIIQPRGDVLVHISDTAPASAADGGFMFKSGTTVALPSVAALGGSVWVRTVQATGSVIHASA